MFLNEPDFPPAGAQPSKHSKNTHWLRIKLDHERFEKQAKGVFFDVGHAWASSIAIARKAADQGEPNREGPAMNLRHIDPRSSDWMDAMMEGEGDKEQQDKDQAKKDDGRSLDASAMSMKDSNAGTMVSSSRPPPTR